MPTSYSIIRETEYRELTKLTLNGRILDLGGSKKSGYQELVGGEHEIITANFCAETGCDVLFDMQKKFPFEDEVFDHALCLNVFEHVFHHTFAMQELSRVLKASGNFVVAVPFMHHIHGSPEDYYRFTRSGLIKLCEDSGFVCQSISEIGSGIFSLFYQTVGGALPTQWLKFIAKKICLGLDSFFGLFPRYRKLAKTIPLGYFAVFIKK